MGPELFFVELGLAHASYLIDVLLTREIVEVVNREHARNNEALLLLLQVKALNCSINGLHFEIRLQEFSVRVGAKLNHPFCDGLQT